MVYSENFPSSLSVEQTHAHTKRMARVNACALNTDERSLFCALSAVDRMCIERCGMGGAVAGMAALRSAEPHLLDTVVSDRDAAVIAQNYHQRGKMRFRKYLCPSPFGVTVAKMKSSAAESVLVSRMRTCTATPGNHIYLGALTFIHSAFLPGARPLLHGDFWLSPDEGWQVSKKSSGKKIAIKV